MILCQLAGLPGQMRQSLPEVNGVLSSSAGNFQNMLPVRKNFLKDIKDGVLILFTGFGVRFHEPLNQPSRIIFQYWYFMVEAQPTMMANSAMKEPTASVETPVTP